MNELLPVAAQDFLTEFDRAVMEPILSTPDGVGLYAMVLMGRATWTATVAHDPPALHIVGAIDGRPPAVLKRDVQKDRELDEALGRFCVAAIGTLENDEGLQLLDLEIQEGRATFGVSVEETTHHRIIRALILPIGGGNPIREIAKSWLDRGRPLH
jgi:hypothetical protein